MTINGIALTFHVKKMAQDIHGMSNIACITKKCDLSFIFH